MLTESSFKARTAEINSVRRFAAWPTNVIPTRCVFNVAGSWEWTLKLSRVHVTVPPSSRSLIIDRGPSGSNRCAKLVVKISASYSQSDQATQDESGKRWNRLFVMSPLPLLPLTTCSRRRVLVGKQASSLKRARARKRALPASRPLKSINFKELSSRKRIWGCRQSSVYKATRYKESPERSRLD